MLKTLQEVINDVPYDLVAYLLLDKDGHSCINGWLLKEMGIPDSVIHKFDSGVNYFVHIAAAYGLPYEVVYAMLRINDSPAITNPTDRHDYLVMYLNQVLQEADYSSNSIINAITNVIYA